MWDDPDALSGTDFVEFNVAWYPDRVVVLFASLTPPFPFDTITFSKDGKQVGLDSFHDVAEGPEMQDVEPSPEIPDEPDRCQQTGCEERATKLTELVRSDNNIRLCDRHYEERLLPNTPETVRVKPYKARL